jgi:hypothetical protein
MIGTAAELPLATAAAACRWIAGASPAAAVRLLHQLCLFPQVFTPPPELQQQLGNDFGGPCTELIEAAQALLQEVGLQVCVHNVVCIIHSSALQQACFI